MKILSPQEDTCIGFVYKAINPVEVIVEKARFKPYRSLSSW